jgi:hypothetical protein
MANRPKCSEAHALRHQIVRRVSQKKGRAFFLRVAVHVKPIRYPMCPVKPQTAGSSPSDYSQQLRLGQLQSLLQRLYAAVERSPQSSLQSQEEVEVSASAPSNTPLLDILRAIRCIELQNA